MVHQHGNETTINMTTRTFKWMIGSTVLIVSTLLGGTVTAMNTLWQIRGDIADIRHTLDYSVDRTAVALTRSHNNRQTLNMHDTKIQVMEDRLKWRASPSESRFDSE